MSPIGRAFIVVNLALAGGFVYFAGTYLQHHTNYKAELASAKTAHAEETQQLNAQITSYVTQVNDFQGQNIALSKSNDNQGSEIRDLKNQLKQKEELLSTLTGSVQALESSANAMSAQIKASTERAGGAYDNAIAAQKAADAARSELSAAQREIQDKERMIASLSDTRDQQLAQLGDLTKQLRDAQTLLALYDTKYPGALAGLGTPPMDGTVTEASGNLVTIKVANNPAEAGAEKFRGGLVAIYDASGYKGDVSVTDAKSSGDSLYLFGRMWVTQPGKAVRAGDRATTNTN